MAVSGIDLGKYKLGWHDTESYVYEPEEGPERAGRPRHLAPQVRARVDDEVPAERAQAVRAQAHARVVRQEHADIDFDDIYYYLKPTEGQVSDWDMLPEEMKATYEKLGIPEAERKFLAGVTAQYESEVVYHRTAKTWRRKGILFTCMDQALIEYPEIVQKYFGTVIPPGDNKFAALNSAVWSGGRSSTCRRACTSTCRCRRTSASTPRTRASSSAR